MTATATNVMQPRSTTASTSRRCSAPAQALTEAPQAAQFKWRATCSWVNGTHSRSTVESFFGLGAEQTHKTEFTLRRRPSGDLRVRGQGRDAGRVRARRPGVLPDGRHRRGRAEPHIQLRSVKATLEAGMDLQGILGIDSDVRNGFDGIKVHVRHRRRRLAARTSRRWWRSRRSARRCSTSSPTRPTSRSRCDEPSRPVGRCRLTGTVDVVVVGAGHSRAGDEPLPARGAAIDHVVLERGEVANSWRHERWDSLRLLTPNWQSRLPGYRVRRRRSRRLHDDAAKSSTSSTATRSAIAAPVRTGTTVTSVSRERRRLSRRDRPRRAGTAARSCSRAARTACRTCPRARAAVPDVAAHVDSASDYRNPGAARRSRRAGRRRVGDRAAARRRDPALAAAR